MSENGNHCVHSGTCHCVSVVLEADNVVGLDNEWDVGCVKMAITVSIVCLLYTSPSPRDGLLSRMPSSA